MLFGKLKRYKKLKERFNRLETILGTPTDQLWANELKIHRIIWDDKIVDAILKKCTRPIDYVEMYRLAIKSTGLCIYRREGDPKVSKENIEKILLAVTKSIVPFLKVVTIEKCDELRLISEKLGPVFNTAYIPHDPNMALLKARVDQVWQRFSRKTFTVLKEKKDTSIEEYEKLFFACTENDYLRFEIADKINQIELT